MKIQLIQERQGAAVLQRRVNLTDDFRPGCGGNISDLADLSDRRSWLWSLRPRTWLPWT